MGRTVVAALIMMSLCTGCSSKLSRDEAKALLIESGMGEWQPEDGSVFFLDPSTDCVRQSGWIQNEYRSLTPEGLKYFKEIQFSERQYGPDHIALVFVEPLEKEITITGIKEITPTTAEVEWEWRHINLPSPEVMTFYKECNDVPEEFFKGTITGPEPLHFTLWDDGWRLDEKEEWERWKRGRESLERQ